MNDPIDKAMAAIEKAERLARELLKSEDGRHAYVARPEKQLAESAERVSNLKTEAAMWQEAATKSAIELAELLTYSVGIKEDNSRLRTALEFYAQKTVPDITSEFAKSAEEWGHPCVTWEPMTDLGERARAALQSRQACSEHVFGSIGKDEYGVRLLCEKCGLQRIQTQQVTQDRPLLPLNSGNAVGGRVAEGGDSGQDRKSLSHDPSAATAQSEHVSQPRWVMILSCDGVQSAAIFDDLEMCLQRCAEDVFGEVPMDDSDNYEEWRQLEKELVEDGFVRFEDGNIRIAKEHVLAIAVTEPETRPGFASHAEIVAHIQGCTGCWECSSKFAKPVTPHE